MTGESDAAHRQLVGRLDRLRRIGQPEDIANVVAFLVSDDASYTNGETIYVAGGPAGTLM